MKFENTGLEGLKADLQRLDEIMLGLGFVREGTWDFDRVTYDRKFELRDGVFYLRIQGHAVEGDVGANRAIIKLITPLLGKHYFPHGVEYGEGEDFPASLVAQCEKVLEEVSTKTKEVAS